MFPAEIELSLARQRAAEVKASYAASARPGRIRRPKRARRAVGRLLVGFGTRLAPDLAIRVAP